MEYYENLYMRDYDETGILNDMPSSLKVRMARALRGGDAAVTRLLRGSYAVVTCLLHGCCTIAACLLHACCMPAA